MVHVAHMDDNGNAYEVLVAKSEIDDLENKCILSKMNFKERENEGL
jgi:hypothetical protein